MPSGWRLFRWLLHGPSSCQERRAIELARPPRCVEHKPPCRLVASDPPTVRRPSPLVPAITPHVTGGYAPLRRLLTTREAMAHPVELPLEASVQHHAAAPRAGEEAKQMSSGLIMAE